YSALARRGTGDDLPAPVRHQPADRSPLRAQVRPQLLLDDLVSGRLLDDQPRHHARRLAEDAVQAAWPTSCLGQPGSGIPMNADVANYHNDHLIYLPRHQGRATRTLYGVATLLAWVFYV